MVPNDPDPDDAVEGTIAPRLRPVGRGEVRRLLPHRTRRMVGPFVFADLVGPDDLAPGAGIDVDAHPHIGLSTLTYLFTGRMLHRDSTGAVALIEPGAVNWMTAGAGVCHTERTPPDDRPAGSRLHGLQTWVTLPTGDEDADPSFQHHPAATVPVERRPGAHLRLVAGTSWGMTSPVTVSSPLVLADLVLEGGSLPIDATHPERAVLHVDGELTIAGHRSTEGHLTLLRPGSTPHVAGTGRAVVLGGEPLGPRRIWWNFVHSDPERIEAAKADWTAQRFPRVPHDHDPFVPLPGS